MTHGDGGGRMSGSVQSEPENETIDGFDPKDEPLPFLSNFQDIFLTVGVAILLGGLSVFGGILAAADLGSASANFGLRAAVTFGLFAVVWMLSEVIVRARRRILPGIVLAISAVVLAVSTAYCLFQSVYGGALFDGLGEIRFFSTLDEVDDNDLGQMRAATNDMVRSVPLQIKLLWLGLPAIAALTAFGYYRRFRLPFSAALFAITAWGLVWGVLLLTIPFDAIRFQATIGLIVGLSLLFAGIAFDMRDPERVSRFSGNGFWLHFFAAPILLFSVLTISAQGFAFGPSDGDQADARFSVFQSILTLLIIASFAVISLLLNRRALIVAGLTSAAVALAIILRFVGLDGAGVVAATMILLGAGVLLLGLGWEASRRALLRFVPATPFFRRLFPRAIVDG